PLTVTSSNTSKTDASFVDWYATMARCVSGLTPIENGSGGFVALIDTFNVATFFVVRSIADTVWSVSFTTKATGWARRSSTATPVGLLPMVLISCEADFAARFTSQMELSPVFATTAVPSASSIATAEGPAPTVMGNPFGDGGIELALGVTARFKADIAVTPEFCTTIGYSPGVLRSPDGIERDSCRLLLTVVATAWPSNVADVAPAPKSPPVLKKPPVKSTLAPPTLFSVTLSGDEATTAGRTVTTLRFVVDAGSSF